MALQPLFGERSREFQIVTAVVLPAILGAVVGWAVGQSAAAYTVLSVIAALGGIAGGFDHDGALQGAKRGLLMGTVYGIGLVIVHAIDGGEAKANLADPLILQIVVTAFFGTILSAIGGFLRGRAESRQSAA